jgi:hypothetical protein
MRETIKSVQKKGFSCHSKVQMQMMGIFLFDASGSRWVHWSQVGEGREREGEREGGRGGEGGNQNAAAAENSAISQ